MRRYTLIVPTRNKGLLDITEQVQAKLDDSGLRDGMLNLFLQHTSASLLVNEGADPQVGRDLEAWMSREVVDGDPIFLHTEEGDDDMSAHVRAALTAVSLNIPVIDGKIALGTWQRVFLWEHRIAPMQRKVVLSLW